MSTLIQEHFSNFTALKDEPEAMITEPSIITCEFVTGCAVHAGDHAVQFIGWTYVPQLGEEVAERRIVVRFAMPIGAARALRTDLNKKLAAGH
jgi:hypothetical protein